MRKKLTNHQKLLIYRLEEWGDIIDIPLESLGYPNKTSEAILIEFGGYMPRSGNKPTSIIPRYHCEPRVREIEMIVRQIYEKKPKQAQALRAKYVMRLKPPEAKVYCDCKERTYYERVEKAEKTVAKELGLNKSTIDKRSNVSHGTQTW